MKPTAADWRSVGEVAIVFGKLGTFAFGGPAAHIAMMNQEIVEKRKWLSHEEFLDLLGATNLIPGPNSTELAIHLGYKRAGWLGLIAAGVCFIAPAMLIVLALAYSYVRFGSLPDVAYLLYGIKPILIAIIVQAVWNLAKHTMNNRTALLLGIITLVLSLIGFSEIALLALAGMVSFLIDQRRRSQGTSYVLLPMWLAADPAVSFASDFHSLNKLFWTFVKIGSVLYGSGYVLLAFLQSSFVDDWNILQPHQVLDAIAVGQFTPGPVFTTATFIGYLIAGTSGAYLATAGIFLPSFVFVALSIPWIPRLRQSVRLSAVLNGVNIASLALMAAVAIQLGFTAIVDLPTALLAALALVVLIRYRLNSTWLLAIGGIVGWSMGYLSFV